jgi:zinc D-Ala-D-Ala carboxypeptidase
VKRSKPFVVLSSVVAGAMLLSGCLNFIHTSGQKSSDEIQSEANKPTASHSNSKGHSDSKTKPDPNTDSSQLTATTDSGQNQSEAAKGKSIPDMNDPNGIDVLVNKTHALPESFQPSDLVVPNIPFLYKGDNENHLMRKVAADALEKLVAAAKKDGIYIVGVSAYRSYETQKSLYNYYVQTQGAQTADKYSAQPGKSEHETGLAIDVAGSSGQCAVEDCFADTEEAKWLAKHVQEYGFIIRYPKGKESITGYNYEPWHIRYVGKDVAETIAKKGITLEEYYSSQEVALR